MKLGKFEVYAVELSVGEGHLAKVGDSEVAVEGRSVGSDSGKCKFYSVTELHIDAAR